MGTGWKITPDLVLTHIDVRSSDPEWAPLGKFEERFYESSLELVTAGTESLLYNVVRLALADESESTLPISLSPVAPDLLRPPRRPHGGNAAPSSTCSITRGESRCT